METSAFQSLKLQFIDIVGLSKDAVHIHIGLLVFFLSVLLLGKGKITATCLFPVFLVALGLELLDLYDDFSSVGYLRWQNSTHDIVNTLVWPASIVVYSKFKQATKSNL